MGMLGQVASNIKLSLENNTYYRFQLEDVKFPNKVNPEDPTRKMLIAKFIVVHNPEIPDHDEFIGMSAQDIIINFWPELEPSEYEYWSNDQKEALKRHTRNLIALANGLGFSQAEINELDPDNLTEKVGLEVMCRVYESRGNTYMDLKTMKPASTAF